MRLIDPLSKNGQRKEVTDCFSQDVVTTLLDLRVKKVNCTRKVVQSHQFFYKSCKNYLKSEKENKWKIDK